MCVFVERMMPFCECSPAVQTACAACGVEAGAQVGRPCSPASPVLRAAGSRVHRVMGKAGLGARS